MCTDNVNGLIGLKNVIHKLSHYVAGWIIICDDHNSSRLAFHHRYTHGMWAFPHELSELSCNQNRSCTQITVYRLWSIIYYYRKNRIPSVYRKLYWCIKHFRLVCHRKNWMYATLLSFLKQSRGVDIV